MQRIDWSAPWFAAVADGGLALESLNGAEVAPRLNALGHTPVRFVPQQALPDGVAYEQFIFDTAQVPTRDNLHDLFNGLVWHRFPLTKVGLNRRQAQAIADLGGVGQVRGPVRDALTLFDENVALLQAPPALWAALRARDWQRLFVDARGLWQQARLVVFGHALMEKLVQPYKSITAHVLTWAVPESLGADLAAWDAWLAGELARQPLVPKPFTPLPVLGVPGWWPENEAPGFYADAGVFRPPRPARA
ncbi:DUF3025 domain-containing protein [Hydrogenophaga sp.]|uniref:DUF3025 domain-containing protein n=1 Tax=Hydrogenophaga sp. TaxID=1904254 RepID=UPI003918774A